MPTHSTYPLQHGVMAVDDNQPCAKWKLQRVVTIHGTEEQIRSEKIKASQLATYMRLVFKVCLMEIHGVLIVNMAGNIDD